MGLGSGGGGSEGLEINNPASPTEKTKVLERHLSKIYVYVLNKHIYISLYIYIYASIYRYRDRHN